MPVSAGLMPISFIRSWLKRTVTFFLFPLSLVLMSA